MIGKISGILDYRADDHVLIDVRGVGYLVFCSDRTLARMPGVGEAVSLYTDLVVREDLLQLYGFPTVLEKEWHRMLMTVQGVGAKVSLAILGALGAEGVARAIALGDVAAFRAAKGIGPKTAQRVVIELKDKAPSLMAMAGRMPAEPVATVEVIEPVADTPRPKRGAAAPVRGNAAAQAEALSALTNLGYAPGEAASAVAEAAGGDPEADTSALIRLSLKLLAPKG
jgi:Holliday junction DNA helicase RuvA